MFGAGSIEVYQMKMADTVILILTGYIEWVVAIGLL
jgi:hypothetical protein